MSGATPRPGEDLPPPADEGEALLRAHLVGGLDEAGEARLAAWLQGDRERQRRWVRETAFGHDLARAVRERATRHAHGYASTRHARGSSRASRSPWRWVAAAAAALLLSLGAWAAHASGRGAPRPSIASLGGAVRIVLADGTEAAAATGASLEAGATLALAPGALATVAWNDGTRIELSQRARLRLEPSDRGVLIALEAGRATCHAAARAPGSPLAIATPQARAEVVGTVFTITSEGGWTALTVAEGTVAFTDAATGAARNVGAGARAIAGAPPSSADGGRGRRELGMDPGPASGTGHQLAFTDVMRHGSTFSPVLILGGAHAKVPGFPLADGWPSGADARHPAVSGACHGLGGRFPAGDWRLTWTGRGRLVAFGDARIAEHGEGWARVAVAPTPAGLVGIMVETGPGDPVRAVRLTLPGHDDADARPFHPDFLARWRGAGVVRTAAWTDGSTDGSALGWDQRMTPASGPRHGAVPLELHAALARSLDADLWLVVPVEADDGYAERLGAWLVEALPPGRHAYVQYGGDAWDPRAPDGKWAAHAAGDGDARAWAAARAARVLAALARGTGGDPRVVRVLDVGDADAAQAEAAIAAAGREADAVAMSLRLAARLTAEAVAAPDPLAAIGAIALADAEAHLARAGSLRALARMHGLRLLGYDAGTARSPELPPMTKARMAEIRDADDTLLVHEALTRVIDGWRAGIGDVLCARIPHENLHAKATSPVGEMPRGYEPQALRAWRAALGAP